MGSAVPAGSGTRPLAMSFSFAALAFAAAPGAAVVVVCAEVAAVRNKSKAPISNRTAASVQEEVDRVATPVDAFVDREIGRLGLNVVVDGDGVVPDKRLDHAQQPLGVPRQPVPLRVVRRCRRDV